MYRDFKVFVAIHFQIRLNNCRSTFATFRLRYLQKHGCGRSTDFFGVKNRWPSSLVLTDKNKLSGCFGRCIRARVVMMKNDPRRWFVFLTLLNTSNKQKGMYDLKLVLFWCNCSHMPIYTKNRPTFVSKLCCTNNACWYTYIWDLSPVYTIKFFVNFLAPTNTDLFWTVIKLCKIQRVQIFFACECSCQILCVCS